MALGGSPSCGCFGKVTIDPWYTATADIVAVALLWRSRPRPLALGGSLAELLRRSARGRFRLTCGAALILAGCLTLLSVFNPSFSDALAAARGDSLACEPNFVDVASGANGESRAFTLELRNRTDQPVSIFGSPLGCLPITIDGLPLTVPGRQRKVLNCKLEFRGQPKSFQHPIALYTGVGGQAVAVAWVKGNVVGEPDP